MTILQSHIEDAPRQLCIDLPPEWEHRRLEVTVRALDEGNRPEVADAQRPRYRRRQTAERVLLDRDALHER